MTTPERLQDVTLAERLRDCARDCAVYSPDQCATLIDGIGHLAMRHMLNQAADRIEAAALSGRGWLPIETAPINKPVLLWNNDTQEIVIGHKPGDAPNDECVVVGMTAAYADAWHAMPEPPEVSDDESEA